MFPVTTVRVMGFFDVYSIFTTNAARTLTTSSGGARVRPTAPDDAPKCRRQQRLRPTGT